MGEAASRFRSGAMAVLLSMLALSMPTIEASDGSEAVTVLSMSDGVATNWVRVTGGLPTGNNYFGVVFGDVNNDGKLDVALQPETGGMRVFTGNGLGTFAEQSTGLVTTGITQTNLILADFNNDGNLDIAGDGVFFGNGGKGGSMLWTQTVSPGSWFAATAADVDLDGKMDIVAGASNGVRVWKGNGGAGGTMAWTPAQTGLPGSGMYFGVSVGDLNHDGNPDIVCADNSNGIKAWTGNGGTAWTNAYTGSGLPTTDSYMGIDLGDVNHDGNLDIVSSDYYGPPNNDIRVWLGDGGAGGSMNFVEASSGLPFPFTNYWTSARFVDMDDDGNLDIVAANYGGQGLKIWRGDGGAGGTVDWTAASLGLPTGAYIEVDTGDFNNDGKVDFLAGFNNGVDIWQNQRSDFNINSYQSASVNLPTTGTWADVQFADVNNDGKLDIGFTSFQGQNRGLRVFLGNGQGIWTNSSAGLPMTASFSGMRFADINHDGKVDIVVAGDGGGGSAGVHVYRGDGMGSWTEVAQVTTRSGAGLELADVNNDGDLDVLTGYWTNTWGPMVFLGNGNFGWGVNVGPTSTITVDDVATADVNHDGKIDIVASSMTGTIGIQLWTGDGSGTSAGWQRNDSGLPTSGVYLGVAFADVNHDGHPDLVAAGYAGVGMGLYVWLGNGGASGTMIWTSVSTGLPATGQYGGVEFFDTNLDGNKDIVCADSRNVGGIGLVYRRGNGGAGGMSWSAPIITGLPTSGLHWGVAYGDVDNDGIPDIAATSAAGVRVYKQGAPPNRAPTIAVTQPVGGEDWTGGTPHGINWNANDMEDPVASLRVWFNYSITGGPPYNMQVAGLQGVPANSMPYTWTVPIENSALVILNATIVDTGGAKGYANSATFQIDSTLPIVVSTSPFAGETGVPTTANVVITWSEGMDRTSAESAFSLKDTATWTVVAGTFSWAGNTLTFSPFSVLASGTQYSANITTAARDISDSGNNLATNYIWTFTTATFVDSEKPTITSVTAVPNPQEVLLSVNISALVRDNVAVGQVWVSVTNPLGTTVNMTMSYDMFSMRYFRARGCALLSIHTFVIWASDSSGNWNSSSGQFECIDTTRPTVSGLTAIPNPAEVFWATNLSALVADNYLLSGAWVEVTAPDMTIANYSLLAGTRFFREVVPDQLGIYTFKVSAVDSVGLWGIAASQFLSRDTTPPEISNLGASPSVVPLSTTTRLAADVADNYLLSEVWVEVTAPDSSTSNQTMAGGPTYYFDYWVDLVGVYAFKVSARDSSGNWNSSAGTFPTMESVPPAIQHTPVASWPVTVALNISADVTDNVAVQGARLNYTDVDGVVRNVSMVHGAFDEYSFVVPGQVHAGTILYHFWAIDGSGNGARSQQYSTNVIERVPNPPTGLSVVQDVARDGFGALRLQWIPPTTNTDGSPLTDLRGYNVYRMTQQNGPRIKVNTAIVQVTTFLDEGLEDGRIYYYNVTAVNSRGIESAPAQQPGTTHTRTGTGTTTVMLFGLLAVVVIVVSLVLLLLFKRRRKGDGEVHASAFNPPPPPPPEVR